MNKKAFISLTAAVMILALCVCSFPSGYAADNSGPIAENLELTTYRGVSVGGRLTAVDPDGDMLTYVITTHPTKGTVELTEDGKFVYTPADGKRGKDYFGYKAMDSEGNRSQEATVIIKISKEKPCVTYSDMEGSASYRDAVLLADKGILTGSCVAGQYLFEPETQVTRGEFLSMCMSLDGRSILSGITTTGFSDNGDISAWQRAYVSTALMSGIISGYSQDGAAVFSANSPITLSEAAVMLNNVLQVTNVASTMYIDDDTVPGWAAQSVSNLSSCGIISSGNSDLSVYVTRADAAEMLAAALELLENR